MFTFVLMRKYWLEEALSMGASLLAAGGRANGGGGRELDAELIETLE